MYRLKSSLPLRARIQIYHSFVQSHINYCSLVWGFSAKSNVEILFVAQKKGIRAIAPGYITYFYKNGVTPGHTKSFFREYNILTVHGIIALNSLLFIEKIRNFSHMIPQSISSTVALDAPDRDSTFESSSDWLNMYNTNIYRSSVFFKGPLLSRITNFSNILGTNKSSIFTIKNRLKTELLNIQSKGDESEWESQNCILSNIPGMRRSNRNI